VENWLQCPKTKFHFDVRGETNDKKNDD